MPEPVRLGYTPPRYSKDTGMRDKISKISGQEEGIAMANGMLLDISRDADQRARLESEFKGQMDMQSKLGYAKQEGREEKRMEVLDFIARGYTTEEIKKRLEARG